MPAAATILFAWVEAAGGWHDAGCGSPADLPAALSCLATSGPMPERWASLFVMTLMIPS